MLGPNAATIDDHVQFAGGRLGIGPDHAQQHGMDAWQHGCGAPFTQPRAQGRTGRTPILSGKLTPLDSLTQEKP